MSALTSFIFTFLKTSTFYSFFSFQISLTRRLLPGLTRLPALPPLPLVLSYCSFSWPHKASTEGSVSSGASIEMVLPLQFCFLKLFSQIVWKCVFSFWFILQIFSFISFMIMLLKQLSQFFPFSPPSPSIPHSLRQFPHHCSCPWVMHIGSLATLFPILYFTSLWLFCDCTFVSFLNPVLLHAFLYTPIPSGNHQNALHIHDSVSVLLVCLVYFLDQLLIDMYSSPFYCS